MTRKILVSVIALSLVLSMIIVSFQQASALEVRTDFYNRHTTASHGDSRICGDHLCAPGEKQKWTMAIWGLQHINSKKIPIAQHGEDIMSELANSPSTVSSMPGNEKISHP